MKKSFHPIDHIISVSQSWDNTLLEFSIYKYRPQTIFDDRHFISIEARELSIDWLEKTLSLLGKGEELAFHSKIKKGGRYYHLPMIDLSCPVSDLEIAQSALRKVLRNDIFSGLSYYDSGRSMHVYGSRFLTKDQWIKTMGALLLANFPHERPIVDSRWIGHRLIGGFSSLRWSSNSGDYLKKPTLITLETMKDIKRHKQFTDDEKVYRLN